MTYPLHFLLALLVPNGRLSQVPFAFLSIVLALGHIWAYGNIVIKDTGFQWNVYTLAVFAMLWMQFCVLTRRSRDTGYSGAIYLPVLLLAVVIFLITIDPKLVWPDAQSSFVGQMLIDWGMRMLRTIYFALLVWGISAAGQDGPNAYGPEFGETRDNDNAKNTVAKRIAFNDPMHKYGRVSKSTPGWGPRRRAAGFGRR